jgi:hypothetical protein
LACTTYFIVKVWDAPVSVQLLFVSLCLFDYVNRTCELFSQ